MSNIFTITCYGKTKTYKEFQYEKMAQEFRTAMLASDGSEAKRYDKTYQDLVAGEKECVDTERPLTPEPEAILKDMLATV